MPKDRRPSSRSFDEIVSGRPSAPQPPARRSVRGAGDAARGPNRAQTRRPAQQPRRKYPRPNKGPIARWLPSWRFVLGAVLSAAVIGIGLFIAAYMMIDVPAPEDVATAESTTVYYADGETEMGQFATVRRQIIDTSELPDHVGNAIVASEDRRFYTNVGVDPIGIARAFVNNVMGGKRQGGSTITQQYVERYYTGDNLGYRGKAKEAILALKIDQQQSKEQILGNYMNTIYFGRGANGIEQAAIEFFDKPAKDLTISESALLAGIIPAPSAWDPAVSPDQARQRWSRTLDLMVTSEFISQAERDAQEFPQVKEPGEENLYEGPQGYLLQYVRDELFHVAGFEEADIETGGYRIVTTIDHRLQEAAIEAAQGIPDDHSPNLRVGLISLDNGTGAIRAMYGGRDYLEDYYNTATQAEMQGGSTFKVFTLAAALEQGINLGKTYPSYGPMVVDGWADPVENYENVNRGQIDLLTATQHSVNTTYALLNNDVGPENTEEMAIRLGLPEGTSGLEPNPSNVLGTASPRVIDTARAFSTIANGGNRTTPHIVDFVETADGAKTYTGPTSAENVLDPQVAADVTYAMSKVVEGGTGSTAAALGRPTAGKTGSSSHYKSAWFVGFVPQLTTAVGLYQPTDDGGEETITPFGGIDPVAGGTWPATIWTNFMQVAVQDLPVEEFPSHSVVVPSTPPPTQEPEEEEETEEPSEEPSEEETEESPSPTPTQSPSPTETEPEPEPSEPTSPPGPNPEPQPSESASEG